MLDYKLVEEAMGPEWARLLTGETGLPSFTLRRGQRTYRYIEHARTQYCYTPHRSDDGYFYVFNYVRRGNRLELTSLRKFRTRNKAKKCMYDRVNRAAERCARRRTGSNA